MYKVKPTEDEKDRIASGNVAILLKYLEDSDRNIIRELKVDKHGNTPFLQGASSVIDSLLTILRRNAS